MISFKVLFFEIQRSNARQTWFFCVFWHIFKKAEENNKAYFCLDIVKLFFFCNLIPAAAVVDTFYILIDTSIFLNNCKFPFKIEIVQAISQSE